MVFGALFELLKIRWVKALAQERCFDLLFQLRGKTEKVMSDLRRNNQTKAANSPAANAKAGFRSPNFLIIGAQKAGSTWLYGALRKHKKVFLPERVELQYFQRQYCEDDDEIKKYMLNFSAVPDECVWVGEKTPGYFWTSRAKVFKNQPPANHNPHIPESIARVLGPNLKLLLSLRHPVSRAISAFGHHGKRKRIRSDETLREATRRLGIGDIGFYDQHFDAWEEVYDPSQFTVLIFESDIVAAPERGLKMICETLDIDRSDFQDLSFEAANKGAERRQFADRIELEIPNVQPIQPADVAYLLEIYRPTLDALRKRFGRRLEVWDRETAKYEEFAAKG